jgi:hypothetical protein
MHTAANAGAKRRRAASSSPKTVKSPKSRFPALKTLKKIEGKFPALGEPVEKPNFDYFLDS